jgi:hypothetical protein
MWSDSYGLELSARHLWTSLSDEAVALRDSYGLTPDARPQSWAYSIGLLLGAGYAKALLGAGVTHIDPIIGLHLGLAHADERLIPTLRGVISPVLLMRDGLKVRLELAATVQFEQRERGLVMSTGFLPGLSVGWGETTKALRERVFPSKPTTLKKTQTSSPLKAAR